MINYINDYHAPEIPDKYKHDCLIIKDMHNKTKAVIYLFFCMVPNAGERQRRISPSCDYICIPLLILSPSCDDKGIPHQMSLMNIQDIMALENLQ